MSEFLSKIKQTILKKGGFDIVISNPPYVKECSNSLIFKDLKSSPYYQAKMDIWYLFSSITVDILNANGVQIYIAPSNWISNFGACKFREKILKETQIVKFVDFGNYKVFDNAMIQTMILVLRKKLCNIKEYKVSHSKLLNKEISIEQLKNFLYCKNNFDFYCFKKLDFNIVEHLSTYVNFADDSISNLLKKIKSTKAFYLTSNEVTQGIVSPQENLNKENKIKLVDDRNVGEGIFVLTNQELNALNFCKEEFNIIKPYFTSKQLHKYYGDKKNDLNIIYANSKINCKISQYPNIKKHLDKYLDILTSDNRPYGLHRSRNEKNFIGEKIISIRKCIKPTFTYVDFDCYVSQTFYIIKTNKIELKYLLAILNSSVIEFWLKHNGKMQGSNFQIDKEPLLDIPIAIAPVEKRTLIINLVDTVLKIKEENIYASISDITSLLDDFIFEIYNLNKKDIELIKQELRSESK